MRNFKIKMHEINLAKTCDQILEELNSKLNTQHGHFYTGFFTSKYGYDSAIISLAQIAKDGYATEGEDRNKDPKKSPDKGYVITPMGQYFIENIGYQKKFQNDLKLGQYSLDIPASIITTNKISRGVSLVALGIALASVVTS